MILDYGTFGVWGALLAGGKTIVSNKTFRCRHQAQSQSKYLGAFNLDQIIQLTLEM